MANSFVVLLAVDQTLEFFFFFQAEDGIRDVDWSSDVCSSDLTSSCACSGSAPAWCGPTRRWSTSVCPRPVSTCGGCCSGPIAVGTGSRGASSTSVPGHGRSEERRVGKECRSRWSPYH